MCGYHLTAKPFQFALSVFFCYIVIVIFTFLLFTLFYSDTTEGLSAHSILIYSMRNYHTNRNLADFVDYIQEQVPSLRWSLCFPKLLGVFCENGAASSTCHETAVNRVKVFRTHLVPATSIMLL